jgi:hypothetical protein
LGGFGLAVVVILDAVNLPFDICGSVQTASVEHNSLFDKLDIFFRRHNRFIVFAMRTFCQTSITVSMLGVSDRYLPRCMMLDDGYFELFWAFVVMLCADFVAGVIPTAVVHLFIRDFLAIYPRYLPRRVLQ